jgi:hypothetical protein
VDDHFSDAEGERVGFEFTSLKGIELLLLTHPNIQLK